MQYAVWGYQSINSIAIFVFKLIALLLNSINIVRLDFTAYLPLNWHENSEPILRWSERNVHCNSSLPWHSKNDVRWYLNRLRLGHCSLRDGNKYCCWKLILGFLIVSPRTQQSTSDEWFYLRKVSSQQRTPTHFDGRSHFTPTEGWGKHTAATVAYEMNLTYAFQSWLSS